MNGVTVVVKVTPGIPQVIHQSGQDHMVSAKMTAEIERCYEALANKRIDIHKYSGSLFDVVFEIITADTFVAGVASKLLDRAPVTGEERAVISAQMLLEDRFWRLDNGQLFDLELHAEIKATAPLEPIYAG